MNKVSQQVFEKIEKERIKMRPAYFFMFSNWFWLFLALVLFIPLTISCVLIIYYFYHLEFFELFFTRPFLALSGIPYLIIIFFVILLFLTADFYRKSRICCRHEEWFLLITIFFGSAVLSGSIFLAKYSEDLVELLERNGFYRKAVISPKIFWHRPEFETATLTVLKVEKIISEEKGVYFFLIDKENATWTAFIDKENVETIEKIKKLELNKKTNQEISIKLLGKAENWENDWGKDSPEPNFFKVDKMWISAY